MEVQLGLSGFVAAFSEPGMARWVAIVAMVFCLALVAAMLQQSLQNARFKRELSEMPDAAAVAGPAEPPGLALDGISLSPIDRVFPRRPAHFLMLVASVSIGTWVVGYMLAPNVKHFLTSPEWLFQPFYIAAHIVALRLFINVYTRNYAAGIAHLDVSRRQAMRGIRPILGPYGALAAAVIALPFCYFDFHYLFSPRYSRMGRDEIVRSIDYLMWGLWSLEWFINAFIWVLLIGFMIKNCLTIGRFPFREPIDVVLHDKLYRPFLQMSAQGSTVVLGFSLITVLYLYYTGGELTDYLGLGITVTLLVVCFVPPWLVLRTKVDAAVLNETVSLRQAAGIGGNGAPATAALASLGPGSSTTAAGASDARLDQALALLKIWHLHNLYGDLGQTEAKAIVVRLLAPAATIGWQAAHNYGDMLQKLAKMMGMAAGR